MPLAGGAAPRLHVFPSKAAGAPAAEGGGFGLDAVVARDAAAAGVDVAALGNLAGFLQGGAGRLSDPLLPGTRPAPAPADWEGEDLPQAGEEVPWGWLKRIALALEATGAAKSTDPMERALERLGGHVAGGGHTSSGGTSSVNSGVAYEVLRKGLHENPGHFTQHGLNARQQALEGVSSASTIAHATWRGFLELRGRLGHHRPTAAFGWLIAGIGDALEAGDQEAAMARVVLGIIVAEQVSIDGGEWLLAESLAFERPPPFGNFDRTARSVSPLDPTHSLLCDPRWFEACNGRLRAIDSQRVVREAVRKAFPQHVPKQPRGWDAGPQIVGAGYDDQEKMTRTEARKLAKATAAAKKLKADAAGGATVPKPAA